LSVVILSPSKNTRRSPRVFTRAKQQVRKSIGWNPTPANAIQTRAAGFVFVQAFVSTNGVSSFLPSALEWHSNHDATHRIVFDVSGDQFCAQDVSSCCNNAVTINEPHGESLPSDVDAYRGVGD
jgi:hypothetical protein